MSAPLELPDPVSRAFDVSRRSGYVSFCRNETGRLLATLAATRTGTLAEFGTGCGVGTAWLRSGVRGDARILTAELDPTLAEAAAEIFEDDPQVEVVAADWSTLRDRGPFSLLFLDAKEPKNSGADTVVDLVEPGGIVVLTTVGFFLPAAVLSAYPTLFRRDDPEPLEAFVGRRPDTPQLTDAQSLHERHLRARRARPDCVVDGPDPHQIAHRARLRFPLRGIMRGS